MMTFKLAALSGFAAATRLTDKDFFQLPALAEFSTDYPITDIDYKFINYVAQFNKSYATSEEYTTRQAIFEAKDLEIAIQNASQSSYVLAHNKFSDYTE
jgi:hypothetical protein